MVKNVLTETHKKNWAGQHSELLYWTSNGQFKSKMNLPLEKVSKIPLGALTTTVPVIFSSLARYDLTLTASDPVHVCVFILCLHSVICRDIMIAVLRKNPVTTQLYVNRRRDSLTETIKRMKL